MSTKPISPITTRDTSTEIVRPAPDNSSNIESFFKSLLSSSQFPPHSSSNISFKQADETAKEQQAITIQRIWRGHNVRRNCFLPKDLKSCLTFQKFLNSSTLFSIESLSIFSKEQFQSLCNTFFCREINFFTLEESLKKTKTISSLQNRGKRQTFLLQTTEKIKATLSCLKSYTIEKDLKEKKVSIKFPQNFLETGSYKTIFSQKLLQTTLTLPKEISFSSFVLGKCSYKGIALYNKNKQLYMLQKVMFGFLYQRYLSQDLKIPSICDNPFSIKFLSKEQEKITFSTLMKKKTFSFKLEYLQKKFPYTLQDISPDFDTRNENNLSFSLEKIIEIFIQLTKVLEEIHDNGFIHKDIKPPNIFLNKQLNPFIADWDLCYIIDYTSIEQVPLYDYWPFISNNHGLDLYFCDTFALSMSLFETLVPKSSITPFLKRKILFSKFTNNIDQYFPLYFPRDNTPLNPQLEKEKKAIIELISFIEIIFQVDRQLLFIFNNLQNKQKESLKKTLFSNKKLQKDILFKTTSLKKLLKLSPDQIKNYLPFPSDISFSQDCLPQEMTDLLNNYSMTFMKETLEKILSELKSDDSPSSSEKS